MLSWFRERKKRRTIEKLQQFLRRWDEKDFKYVHIRSCDGALIPKPKRIDGLLCVSRQELVYLIRYIKEQT
jgi:hypothetical protein